MIMTRTEEDLKNVFQILERSAKDKQLILNESKAKLIRIGKTMETTQNRRKITTERPENNFEMTKFN